ncbi:MAG: hypothetical protein CVU43_08890 [Chloroflexi bacterium HGW-Chloroflexi-5]|jgi:hypothetical protein|nr:MAG: hypothetical protein CVU43_08890 [Chloroflexi bacterium HGW-Chloroflexi-5]
MNDFILMTCPTCGGKIKIQQDVNQLVCIQCGNEFIVRRDENSIGLVPIIEKLGKINIGVDRTSYELSVRRIKEEIVNWNNYFESLSIMDGRLAITIITCIIGSVFLALAINGSFLNLFLGIVFFVPVYFEYKHIVKIKKEQKKIKSIILDKEKELNGYYQKLYVNQ